MRTLRELTDFVGFPYGAVDVARYGGPWNPSLAVAGLLVNTLDSPERGSLRSLIQAVQNLPPITLEAELLSGTNGEEPYDVRIRLGATQGIIWNTDVSWSLPDGRVFGTEKNYAAMAGDFVVAALGAGVWTATVTRAGIGGIGMTVLNKAFGPITVRKAVVPPPDPPPPPPPVVPPPRPLVTCNVSRDGNNPGFGGVNNFVVSGSGFGADEIVEVFQNGAVAGTPSSDTLGTYSYRLGILGEPSATRSRLLWSRTRQRSRIIQGRRLCVESAGRSS